MSDSKPGVLVLSIHQAKVLLSILVKISVKGVPNIHKSRLQQLLGVQLDDFDKARLDLIKEHCELDEKGEPKTENDQYKIKDMGVFDKAFKALQESIKIEIGTEDPVKEKAVNVTAPLLTGDECPALTPEESVLLVGIVDAFTAAKTTTDK